LCYISISFRKEIFVEEMLILGIDTSCDDTSASIVEDGCRIISNVISSQNEIHTKYGGIVPELASRRHIEMIWPVVNEAMEKASVTFNDISAIAVSHGPGLIGSLLVGVCFAKSISYSQNIPMVAVNHLEGHILSIFLEKTPGFPYIGLVVSGGHTSIYLAEDFGKYTELGRTRDDAAGEAYDKVAKLLGFGYPGGPIIDKLASKGNPEAITFPRAKLKEGHDFSFSGLKTSVLNYTKKHPDAKTEDIASSFQAAVVDVLVNRVLEVAELKGVKEIVLSGGVAANSGLRERITQKAAEKGLKAYLPSLHLCTDNAAMVAATGYHLFKRGEIANYSLNPKAFLPLGSANGQPE
jgi:N6-L-threonylcarbamoyladenine synthase